MRTFVDAGGSRFYGPGDGRENVRVNIGDLGDLGDLFGGGGGGLFDGLFGFGPRSRRGEDVETEVTLSFDEAVSGTTVALSDGTKVRITAGVADGARIRVRGKGGAGGGGGERGDMFVRVSVEPHPVFRLGKNGDLTVAVPLTFTEAALGAKIEVPTLDGTVTVKVPAGTQNGRTLRVRGRGAPRSNGGRGDLHVKVEVEVPQKLSRQEKEILERLAAASTASPREHLERYMQRDAEAS